MILEMRKRLDYVFRIDKYSKLNNENKWRDAYDHLINKKNLHFDKEYDIHTSSKKFEKNEYRHDLDLLIISN